MSGQATNKTQSGPQVGPIIGATVVTPSIDAVLDLYGDCGFRRCSEAPAWGRLPPVLEGPCTARAWLASSSGRPWLQLVEIPSAVTVDRYRHAGWFSLEVGSSEIDALATDLAKCDGFEILAGPAPLEVSDDIIATQVIGPAGELYYFTEVRKALPPFDLPQPRHRLDELFIAVATTVDRNAALAFWQALTGNIGLAFETRIGVLNRGLGLPAEHHLPVGIMQLAGANLIEIDQIPTALARPALASGIAMISVAAPNSGHVQGADGEWLELVGPSSGPSPQPPR